MVNIKRFNNSIEDCIDKIIKVLTRENIFTWSQFISKNFDRNEIDKIIDTTAKDMKEFEEIKFRLKLELFNANQLNKMLSKYIDEEDYDKCILIRNKMNKITTQ